MAQEIVQKSTEQKKTYHYSKGKVALDFTLTLENSGEMRSFHSCLVEALKDLEADITASKN